jgi:aminoglycoside phosphotransferase (APT) family kinase protein
MLDEKAGSKEVRPALMHGDFAPWNVKAHPRTHEWQVLDWERGEFNGIPVWDWLHFEVQPAILVRRDSAASILVRLEKLFQMPEFKAHAERAGVCGIERPLALAYFLYSVRVQRQTEGAVEMETLLDEGFQRWIA